MIKIAMNKLLDLAKFLISNIVTNKDGLEITIATPQENVAIVNVKADSADIPIIIGKKGIVIRALRSILRIRAPLDNKFIDISIDDGLQHN
ncbi:MAG: KH domain-containing protein [Patescibacteria group bacterium]